MFSKIIKTYRSFLNISQEEMAHMLGISTNHLSRIELGKTYPSGDLIKTILQVISNDTRCMLAPIDNSNLHAIILLFSINRLSLPAQELLFKEIIHLINYIASIDGHYNR